MLHEIQKFPKKPKKKSQNQPKLAKEAKFFKKSKKKFLAKIRLFGKFLDFLELVT
jgi:hypothetical protein